MKPVVIILRIISGSVFIFSGIVKGIDPLGSTYKFHDYFQAFGLDFLHFLTLPLAITLCLAEFITGFAVLTGIRYREGILGMFILIAFFTPLTLVIALTNPVSDCGCFGDAIKMTNWETFLKNIILFPIIAVLFLNRKKQARIGSQKTEWIIASATGVLFILFNLYNLTYLPIIDFLPYKTGNNLPELMKIPEGAPVNRYETTFIYEKDGARKEFTLENYPADDTTWIFVDSKNILVEKGYEPPVHDFSIITPDNSDITDLILENQGYTLLMISRKLDLARKKRLEAGFSTGRKCLESGIDFYILTASGADEVTAYDNGLKFCLADETTLKTVVRSNPGYILLKGGTVIGKWSWANLPDNPDEMIVQ